MKENMLDVLLYLFENYMIEGQEFQPDQETLTVELAQAGFGDGEINKAFDWLEDLSELCDPPSTDVDGGAATSTRHFSPEEQLRFDPQAQGLLLKLEQSGILDPSTRELVIDRIMALETAEIDTEHLKWVIMMVLCNRPGHEDVVAWAEELIIDGIEQHIH
jgi:Smg protein